MVGRWKEILAEESEDLVGFQLPCLNALIILTLSNFSKFLPSFVECMFL